MAKPELSERTFGGGVREKHPLAGESGVINTHEKSPREGIGFPTGIISKVDGVIDTKLSDDEESELFPIFIGYNICNPATINLDTSGTINADDLWLYWAV